MMKKMTMHEEMVGIGESGHIPYGAAGAIPFRWEKEPGKPIMENPYSDTSLPPLSPPPNRLFSFDSSSSCSSSCSSNFSYGRHSWAATPRLITRKVIHIFNHKFLRKPTSKSIVRPPPIPKTKSLPSKLGLHMLKPKPKPEPKPSTESKKNKGQELYEPNNNGDAYSTNLSQVLNPNSNSHSHELLSYSCSSSSSSSSYHSSSSVSCENVEVVPRRSGGGGIVAINVHDDDFGCGCKSRPYTMLDMLTYSNPSSPLINLRRSSCGVNYSGPINPSHYGMVQSPSVSLTKDEHVKEEDEEEVEDYQTTFAEVVAASAQMFGPRDNYGSFNNSTLGCMPCRSHIGRIAHN